MIEKRDIFTFLGILGICILWYCHSRVVYNEMDVVPFAMGQFDPDYLASDWYLHLDIEYRSWFAYPVGYLGRLLGVIPTVLVGRLILYILFSLGLTLLIRTLEQNRDRLPFFLAIVLFNAFFNNGCGAAEWMIGGLETKSFAYAFVLFSLYCGLRHSWFWSFFWAGLAFSFHMLVGMYHAISLGFIVIYALRQGQLSWNKLFLNSPIFFLTGIQGLLGVQAQWPQTVSNEALQGWQTYVSVRVAHHVLPFHFAWSTWLKILGLVWAQTWAWKHTDTGRSKRLIIYSLSTLLFTITGLVVYALVQDHIIMRLYFFRFSDIMLPMTTLFILAALFSEKITSQPALHKARKFMPYLLGLLILIQVIIFSLDFRPSQKAWMEETSSDVALQQWIKENTEESEGLVVNPKQKYVYLNYERPVLVTWKHAPQNGVDLYEWNRRLEIINGNKPVTSRQQVLDSYDRISIEQCQQISKNYPDMKYIIVRKDQEIPLQKLYTGDHLTVYALSH